MILSMPNTMLRAIEITVDLQPEQAMALFTPEGERRWADGWNPSLSRAWPPRRRRAVFSTGHGGHQTTWVMVDNEPGRVRYARVTEGMRPERSRSMLSDLADTRRRCV